METFNKRLTDGLLAGTACFTASTAMAQDVANNVQEPNTLLQVLIPVITGVIVPFLKEWTLNMARRRKERKDRKAADSIAP